MRVGRIAHSKQLRRTCIVLQSSSLATFVCRLCMLCHAPHLPTATLVSLACRAVCSRVSLSGLYALSSGMCDCACVAANQAQRTMRSWLRGRGRLWACEVVERLVAVAPVASGALQTSELRRMPCATLVFLLDCAEVPPGVIVGLWFAAVVPNPLCAQARR